MRCGARTIRTAMIAVGSCALGGCRELHNNESALDPAGPQAHHISVLTWWFIGVCVVVYLLVALVTAMALIHRRRGQSADASLSGDPITHPDPGGERRVWAVVSTAIFITVVTLFGLLIADFATGRSIHDLGDDPDPLFVQVTGQQWWWKVDYISWPARFGAPLPVNRVTDANEIHVPVDPDHPVTVAIQLNSVDVIHSFWVPNLHGKRDLIPGHPTTIYIRADRPGIYWGECAEYCGYQHAQMRIAVVAQKVEDFQRWLQDARKPAAEPTNDMQRRGRDVLLRGTCIMCHRVGGTNARGLVGPDLTHVASRLMLGAGAIPNRPGHLAGWIADAQRIKPGCRMPQNNIPPGDLRALLEYVENLK